MPDNRRDKPDQIAFNFAAPSQERYDANAELSQTYQPLASELLPTEELKPVIEHIMNDLAEQDMMQKAQGKIIVPFPQKQQTKRGMQSVYLDELQVFAAGDYFDKPSPLGFDSLRQMVDQTPILNAVILTRIRQINRFCRPQENEDSPGFVIRHIDSDHQLQSSEEQSIKLLHRFVNNCGWEFNPRQRQRLKRNNFTGFMAKVVRDSLTMDSAAIETEFKRDKSKGIDGFYAVDGATIRLCTEEGYQGDDEIFALQVVQGLVRTAYSYEDLIYVPRNPRTDVRLAGYGLGETELLIRVVTGFLNAMTYNIKGFDDNAIPKGMLHLSGDYDTNDLTAFKRYWNAMVKGINNAWTVPVMVSKDQESKASFERFGIEFNEMYFSKWMTFLTSIICAVYGMSPDEINFESFASSQSSLSGSDTAEKLADSKDKGLRPLMSYLESIMTDYIITDFSDKYVFRWAGLDPEDQEKRHEMRKLILTVNEARAQEGHEAMEGPLGDAPLNPSLMGAWMQQQQQAQEDYGQEAEDQGEPEGGEVEEQDQSEGEALNQKDERENNNNETQDFGGDDRQGDFGKAFSVPTIYTIGD